MRIVNDNLIKSDKHLQKCLDTVSNVTFKQTTLEDRITIGEQKLSSGHQELEDETLAGLLVGLRVVRNW